MRTFLLSILFVLLPVTVEAVEPERNLQEEAAMLFRPIPSTAPYIERNPANPDKIELGTMLFFAVFDPADLAGTFDEDIDISRDAGYAAGFFFFWVLTASCSAVTAWLVRTAKKRDAKHRG